MLFNNVFLFHHDDTRSRINPRNNDKTLENFAPTSSFIETRVENDLVEKFLLSNLGVFPKEISSL